jgi:hypothetical protein
MKIEPNSRYSAAAILSFTTAVLSIPLFTTILVTATNEGLIFQIINRIIAVVILITNIFLYYSSLQLFHEKAQTHTLDNWIKVAILLSLVEFITSSVLTFIPKPNNFLTLFSIGFLLIFAVISVMFGAKLSGIKHSLFGYRKRLSKLHVAFGILSGTILLIPIAICLNIAINITYGLIFLRAVEAKNE